ncbi:unnamed protein product [Phyllotreta striolata]|uniref:RZZ complex subunit KNTC1/ROD C-terminal domain-containing protein n=1 Tax=Phyllotreta striolata TaxID=444603 RepID=A0A9N9TFP4_PHYSR|nr:unnamed protein product [Phyllotreta striolata]
MGDFEVRQSEFPKADETINCGKLENLYEVVTLTSFKCDNENITDVAVNSTTKNGYLYFATNNILKICDGQCFSNVIFNKSFNSNINNLSVSSNSPFVALGTESGLVELIYCNEYQNSSIFSKCLLENSVPQNVFAEAFILEDDLSLVDNFLVIYQSGNIFRVSIKKEDEHGPFQFDVKELFSLNSNINLSAFNFPFVSTNGTNGTLNILNVHTNESIFEDNLQFKKIMPFKRGFLCLNFDGSLTKICSLTLKCSKIYYDYFLDDILLLQDETKILTVTKPNEIGDYFLQLIDTDFKEIFSLKLNYPVHLISTNSTEYDIMFMYYIIDNEGKFIEFNLQQVYETDHESRYSKLISMGRFDEAEALAKKYNIDPSFMLKAKAQLLVDKTECNSDDISKLISLMDSIYDGPFKLQCCNKVDFSQFSDVKRILEYGSRIQLNSREEKKEQILYLKNTLNELLFRCTTFTALSGNNKDIQSWLNFSQCNLLDEIKHYLRNQRIEDAILLYSRLDQATTRTINQDFVNEILNIFNEFQWELYQPFLPVFILTSAIECPSIVTAVSNWLCNKILAMEAKRKDFCEYAIKIVRYVIEIFIGLEQSNEEDYHQLTHCLRGLKILRKLKNEFNVGVELIDFLEGPQAFVSTLLNLPLSPETYENVLKKFCLSYMLQHKIDCNEIFEEKISEHLIDFDVKCLPYVDILLSHIDSVDVVIQSVSEILLKAPVPWAGEVKALAYRTMHNYRGTEKIKYMLANEVPYSVINNPNYSIDFRDGFDNVINGMIAVGVPEVVDDIFKLCVVDSEYVTATLVLIDHFVLKKCEINEALSVLNRNKPDVIELCIEKIILKAELAFQDGIFVTSQLRNYATFLERLLEKFPHVDDGESSIREIVALFWINKYFKLNLSYSEIQDKMNYLNILETISRSLSIDSDFDEILEHSKRIAYYLSKDKDEVLMQLCDCIKRFAIIIKSAEYMCAKTTSSKNQCLMAMLILKYLGYVETEPVNTTFFDSCDQTLPIFNLSPEGNGKFVNALKLAEKLIGEASLQDDKDFVVYDILMWVRTCFYLIRPPDHLKSNVIPSSTVLKTINACYLSFIKMKKTSYDSYSGYYNFFASETDTDEDIHSAIKLIQSSLDVFFRESQHLTLFSLLSTLSVYFGYSDNDGTAKFEETYQAASPMSEYSRTSEAKRELGCSKLQEGNTVVENIKLIRNKCIRELIKVIVLQENIDTGFLIDLFDFFDKDCYKYLFNCLSTFKRDPKKLETLSKVGLELSELHGNNKGKTAMVATIISCKWWRKYSDIQEKTSYDDFFRVNAKLRLKVLLELNAMQLEDIPEYCLDYELEPEVCYREYLKSLLTNFKTEYEIEVDDEGKRKLIIKTSIDDFFKKCMVALDCIKDKQKMFDIMEELLQKLNFYYYEVFITIYRILGANDYSKELELLDFLTCYSRIRSPSQREIDQWYVLLSNPDVQILDPLSEFRFPYSFLLFSSDIWSILRSEIGLDCYTDWLCLTNLLNDYLKIDDICTFAVKQEVLRKTADYPPSEDWVMCPKLNDLIEKVDECLQNMKNLEVATATAYFLMNSIPNGADKLNAAKLCVKYAKQYRNQNPDDFNANEAYAKIESKVKFLSVCRILTLHNLNREDYLSQYNQPAILIKSLYERENVSKASFDELDINGAAYELAEFFKLDIKDLKVHLLEFWLSQNEHDSANDSSGQLISDEDYLTKAKYLCRDGDQDYWELHLLNIVLNESGQNWHLRESLKVNAAKCFYGIMNEERIVEITKSTLQEFRDFINKLELLRDLKLIGITLDMDGLKNTNKRDLIKKLSHMGTHLAIKCMGSICVIYNIEKSKYWEYIINSCIRLEKISEFKTYVRFLRNHLDKSFYLKAWQVIVDEAFKKIKTMDGEQLESSLVDIFRMIQSCPVAFNLNFEKCVKVCLEIRKEEYVKQLLRYIPDDSKTRLTQLLENNVTNKQMIIN